MKKTLVFTLVAASFMLLFTACDKTETLPKRFDSFVEKVEKDCASYSEEDWDKANTKFEQMVNEFKENMSSYSEDAQKQIRTDISKYVALVTKSGVKSAIDAVNGFARQIPEFFEDLGTFFKTLLTNPDGEKKE